MRTLFVLALAAGCTAANPGFTADDAGDMASSAAADLAERDGGAELDLAPLPTDLADVPPGADLAGADLAHPCGGAGQECCDNGGPINPPMCAPNDGHPIGGQLACNTNHSGSGSTCVYCGRANQPCCNGSCPNALPGQVLTCKTVAGRDVKFCE